MLPFAVWHPRRRALLRLARRLCCNRSLPSLLAAVPLTYQTSTPPGGHGALDTPAVWVSPNPNRSLLFITDKTQNYVEIHDPVRNEYLGRLGGSGTEPGKLSRPNAVAVAYGVPSAGGPLDVLFVVERDNRRVTMFLLPYGNYLGSIGTGLLNKPMGIAIHWNGAQPQIWITDIGPTPQRIVAFNVVPGANGLSGTSALTFGTPASAILESIAIDDVNGHVLIDDEAAGDVMVYDFLGHLTGRFGAGHFVDQTEGIALFDGGNGRGYIIVTDQQAQPVEWEVFDRQDFRWLRQFSGVASATDGITLVQGLPNFPHGGFFASHADNAVQAYSWDDIAHATGLCAVSPCSAVDTPDPETTALGNNRFMAFPTPFRGSGTLRYRLDTPSTVVVTVYDLRGSVVARLDGALRPAGVHTLDWDGRRSDGAAVPSGVYLMRAQLGGASYSQKITVLR